MDNTCAFLDAVKSRHGLPSDYALAKTLRVTKQCVSKYRNQTDFLGDSTALRVAELLEIDPALVVAAVHRERAKSADQKAVWSSIIARLGGIAAALFISVSALFAPLPADAADHATFSIGQSTDYAKLRYRIRIFVSLFLTFFKNRRATRYRPAY